MKPTKVRYTDARSEKDAVQLLKDLKGDIEHISSFEQFDNDRACLLGWIDEISKAMKKLKTLEDYEAELETDMLLGFKAIVKGVYFIEHRTTTIRRARTGNVHVNFETGSLDVSRGSGASFYNLEEYGTSWAFTKQELVKALEEKKKAEENEKEARRQMYKDLDKDWWPKEDD